MTPPKPHYSLVYKWRKSEEFQEVEASTLLALLSRTRPPGAVGGPQPLQLPPTTFSSAPQLRQPKTSWAMATCALGAKPTLLKNHCLRGINSDLPLLRSAYQKLTAFEVTSLAHWNTVHLLFSCVPSEFIVTEMSSLWNCEILFKRQKALEGSSDS